ncbi:MAG: (d)CMP kinase [Chloroflexota bacterium]
MSELRRGFGRGLKVSLDGPGSSGKSSVGAAAAVQLGYRFLDTGVLYRAITWLSLKRGVDSEDGAALAALVPQLELVPDAEGRMRRVKVDGSDVTDQLHAPEVDRAVSAVSRQPDVRAALLMTQRSLAAEGRIIVAGRDIGSVVLPDADLKLYLDVSLEERARRRASERGLAIDSPEAGDILEDLRRRDYLDSSRAVAPLRVPDGAVLVRSDGREFEQTVGEVVRLVETYQPETSPADG